MIFWSQGQLSLDPECFPKIHVSKVWSLEMVETLKGGAYWIWAFEQFQNTEGVENSWSMADILYYEIDMVFRR